MPGEGIDRTLRIGLTAISPAATRGDVTVKQDPIRRDRATASEIVSQIEQALGARSAVAR